MEIEQVRFACLGITFPGLEASLLKGAFVFVFFF